MSATKVRMDRVVYNTAIACCSQLKLWRRGVSSSAGKLLPVLLFLERGGEEEVLEYRFDRKELYYLRSGLTFASIFNDG